MDDKFGSLLKRLEAVTVKLEAMPAAGAGAAAGAAPPPAAPVQLEDDSVAPMVAAFDAFISGPIAEYVAAAKTLDLPEVRTSALGLIALIVCRPPVCKKNSDAQHEALPFAPRVVPPVDTHPCSRPGTSAMPACPKLTHSPERRRRPSHAIADREAGRPCQAGL